MGCVFPKTNHVLIKYHCKVKELYNMILNSYFGSSRIYCGVEPQFSKGEADVMMRNSTIFLFLLNSIILKYQVILNPFF